MSAVYLRGLGLVCARGADLPASVAAVKRSECAPGRRTVTTLDGPLSMPFYGVADTPLLARVQAAVDEASADAGLGDLRDVPLLIGSSSLDVALMEQLDPGAQAGVARLASLCREALAWRGPDLVFSSACTSALQALLAGQAMIAAGLAEHVVVLGVEFANQTTLAGFGALGLLSPSSAKPFDAERDGLVLGEAVAALVLSRAPSAVRLLAGAALADTHSATGTEPEGTAVLAVMQDALQRAGVSPSAIGLVKAQAAGSPATDRAEALALKALFTEPPALSTELPMITSLKPWLGHSLGASGAAELALLLGCWRDGFTPGTPGFVKPDAEFALRPQSTHAERLPEFCLFNLLGFGGSNISLVLGREPL